MASQKLRPPTGLDNTASAVPLRISRASEAEALNTAPNNPASSITASSAVLHQLRLVPKGKVVRRAAKKISKTAEAGHQQQEYRLPNQFHEGIGGDGDELSHLASQSKLTG